MGFSCGLQFPRESLCQNGLLQTSEEFGRPLGFRSQYLAATEGRFQASNDLLLLGRRRDRYAELSESRPADMVNVHSPRLVHERAGHHGVE